MKLTWFGNTTFRIHIGGQIVVVEPAGAPERVDGTELVSGADLVVQLDHDHPAVDLDAWKPRARARLLDAGDRPRAVEVLRGGAGTLILDADEDMPLLLLPTGVPTLGRWVEKAVVVLAGAALAERGEALIAKRVPRLIALAGAEVEQDAAFAHLPAILDGAGLVALEQGMAIEV